MGLEYLHPGRRSSRILRCVFSTVNSVTEKYIVIRRTKRNTESEKTAIPTFDSNDISKNSMVVTRTQKFNESAIRSRRELSRVVYDMRANQIIRAE